ncbi:MAG: type II toxin-antitoxin system VapC family toxin [Bauldia sp.]|nr:type II toxin-antitoxin system VapC family toxin [Bauldia sp.]
MIRFLLDTDTLSNLVRRPHGTVAERVANIGAGSVATSIVVAAEIRFGLAKRPSKHLALNAAKVLSALTIIPFESPADRFYADLRADLERRGQSIGANDMLIAAHALALDCTLVTGNEREFRRIAGLRVENWLHGR